MKEEKPKLTMPRSHIRERVIELETHNATAPIHVPKSHDDFMGVQHLHAKHHLEIHKE